MTVIFPIQLIFYESMSLIKKKYINRMLSSLKKLNLIHNNLDFPVWVQLRFCSGNSLSLKFPFEPIYIASVLSRLALKPSHSEFFFLEYIKLFLKKPHYHLILGKSHPHTDLTNIANYLLSNHFCWGHFLLQHSSILMII